MIEKKYLNIIICPICKRKVFIGKNLISCAYCKHKYHVENDIPMLIIKELQDYASLSKEKWNVLYGMSKLKRRSEINQTILSTNNFISKYKNFYSKGIFLDLGCGIARNGAFLARKGVSFIGVDISYEGLYKSKLLFLEEKLRGCFVQAGFTNLPFKDNSIQFVYAGLSILQYEKNIKAALLETYRVLKPGGRMLATFPVGSITTLTYHQLRGDIPNIPFVKSLIEFMHIKLFKSKYLKYGYGQTSFIGKIKSNVSQTPFQICDIGCFDIFYPINFAPETIKPFIRKLLKLRLFWPEAYIEVIKPKA